MTASANTLPVAGQLPTALRSWADFPAFMEHQFPVSKVSKESYKERKANNGQTLTGLGKWWGRKPLVLVRAAILGLLLPATDNPTADRETFRIDEALAADLAKTKAENETLKAELHAFGLKFEALEATTKLLQHHSAVEAAPTPGTPSVGASFTGGFVNPSSTGGGILTGDQTTVE